MSCQTLTKTLKCFRNCKQILSRVSYTSVYSIQNFKKCAKVYSRFPPLSANFGTSVSQRDEECPIEEEECLIDEADYYTYDADRRLATHVEDPNMPIVKLTVITKKGEKVPVEARVGMTVLRAALKYNIPIEAACEGKKACTTCHCYVEDANAYSYFTPPDIQEDDLLDIAPFCKPNSRLSCQMKIIKRFKHITIRLPFATANFAVDKKSK